MRVSITRENTKSFPQHKHAVFEIMHYVEGTGVLRTECGDISFAPGTVVVMPPEVMHGSVADGHFKNICLHVAMSLPDIKEPLIMPVDSEAGILSDLICRLVIADREKNSTVVNRLIKAEEELISYEVTTADNNFTAAARHVRREIMDHFTEDTFDVAEIIEATHYSDDYFRAKYRERYHTTPYAYLLELRINYAADLLREYGDNCTVAEIARQSGFRDPVYFSRIFKRRQGISPRDFVKKLHYSDQIRIYQKDK